MVPIFSLVLLIWHIPAHAEITALARQCVADFKKMSQEGISVSDDALESVCGSVVQLDDCRSGGGQAIFHYEKRGSIENPKRILAKALIHGDELRSGLVARAWMLRLSKIAPRNTWRVIPVANPDGWAKHSRTNSAGVDLNRNFPTHDWNAEALTYWRREMKSDPRRYPGPKAASEVETRCLVREIDDFKPDFIISVHTPLGVLDLDGPKVKNPPVFKPLPWTSLGNFPGSLGRYMWVDRKVPVLTIELKDGKSGHRSEDQLEDFDRLQDLSGTVAIQAAKLNEFIK